MQTTYPWQLSAWQHLVQAKQQQRLPHAQLLAQPKGSGKLAFVMQAAKLLLCESNQATSCDTCRSCHLFSQQTHPDFYLLEPEETGKKIKIDQIRSLNQQLTQSKHLANYKVAVLSPAEAMNMAAANALLKTLEEPQPQVILFLLSDNSHVLLPTIRSRCQLIRFAAAEKEKLAWLQSQTTLVKEQAQTALYQADGAPLAALISLDEQTQQQRADWLADWLALTKRETDCVSLANKWQKVECANLATQLSYWIADLLAYRLSGQASKQADDAWLAGAKQALAQSATSKIYLFWDKLLQFRQFIRQNANLNLQLQLEGLLFEWQQLCKAE